MSPGEELFQIEKALENCEHLIRSQNTRYDRSFYLALRKALLYHYYRSVSILNIPVKRTGE